MSTGWKSEQSPGAASSHEQVQYLATSSVEQTISDDSTEGSPAERTTAESISKLAASRHASHEDPGHRVVRRWLLACGIVIVLAGCGLGLWLGTSGSGSSTNAEQEQTARGLFNDGLQAQIEGNSALAANDYLRSLNLEPNDKLVWYDLGLIEQQAGVEASAEHDYEASIAHDPRFVPALYNLGTLVASTDPARATTLYERVIAIQPKDAEAHLNLGFALHALGKVAQGNAEIAEAVRLDRALSSRAPNSRTTPEPRAP
jgi:hypothetical protein